MENKSSYFWALLGRFVPQLLHVVTTMVLARLLTPDDFGTIGVLAIVFAVATTLIDSGLGGSLIKEEKISDADCSTISLFNLAVSVFFYAVLFFFAPCIERYYDIPRLCSVTRWMGLSFIINAFRFVPASLLTRSLRFKTISFVTILASIVSCVLAVLTAHQGWGCYSIVAYRLCENTITTILFIAITRHFVRLQFSKDSFMRLFSFGAFTTIANLINTFYENLLTALTGKYLNVKEAGYMSQAKTMEDAACKSLAITVSQVVFPILTKKRHSIEAFKAEASSINKIILMLVVPLLLTIVIFASPIVTLLYGHGWERSAFYVAPIIVGGIFILMENLNRAFIKAYTKVAKLALVTLVTRLISLVVIIVSLIINPLYIVYGFVLSSMINYLGNQLLYCNMLNESLLKSLWRVVDILLPSVVYVALGGIMVYVCESYWMPIAVCVVLLGLYYWFILPMYGIRLVETVRLFRNSSKVE